MLAVDVCAFNYLVMITLGISPNAQNRQELCESDMGSEVKVVHSVIVATEGRSHQC